jgi:hypothetical protein
VLLATPTLHLASRGPVTVQVAGFKPHERVTVTLFSGHRWTKAGATGAGGAMMISSPARDSRAARSTG